MSNSSRFLFVFAVLAGSIGTGVAHADAPPSLFGTPMPADNGFKVLQEAVEKYGGSLSAGDNMGPTERLRYQRANVTRNQNTLRKIREALAMEVRHPSVRDLKAEPISYDGFKKLGLLLKQESAVKMSNADWIGALNSNMDCIALGIGITRGGPLEASLAGLEIEAMGRGDMDLIVKNLSTDELRASSARLAKIEASRSAFSDALLEEKARALAQTKQAFEEEDWTDTVEQTTKPNGDHFTDDEKAVLNNIGESEVLASLAQVLDQVEKDAAAPYRPMKVAPIRGADPWSRMMTDVVALPSYRVNYEASRAQNLLLAKAFELTADKIQSGKYPATPELPEDPFGPKGAKLTYRLQGDKYLLYSFGPDAKDNNGTPLVLTEDGQMAPGVSGDLVAPVYNQ